MSKVLPLLLLGFCSKTFASYLHAAPPAPVAVEAVYSAPHAVGYAAPHAIGYAAPQFIKYVAPPAHHASYSAPVAAPVIKYTLGTPVTTTTTTYAGFAAAPPPPAVHYAAPAPPPAAVHYAAPPPAAVHYSAPPLHYAAPPPRFAAPPPYPYQQHSYGKFALHAAPDTVPVIATFAAPVAAPVAAAELPLPCDNTW